MSFFVLKLAAPHHHIIHDYEGISFRSKIPFVMLDLSNLDDIKIDLKEGTVWVQAGATLGQLYYAIAKKSKVHGFAGGLLPRTVVDCSEVAGHALKRMSRIFWIGSCGEAYQVRYSMDEETLQENEAICCKLSKNCLYEIMGILILEQIKRTTTYSKAKIWGEKYFKGNFERLAKVKSKVDPNNFFRNEQSIPPYHADNTKKTRLHDKGEEIRSQDLFEVVYED
ncbi:hypothetical protein HAX54_007915 [Datura stramonium]|uniref:Berberine/berberine-like domain-containing protein n=1 Tax=Datura stramonium TaxID=4076 RepID=A0ABS8WWZ3_DATST|nr:hypothetical protein [Datura stramonium]